MIRRVKTCLVAVVLGVLVVAAGALQNELC